MSEGTGQDVAQNGEERDIDGLPHVYWDPPGRWFPKPPLPPTRWGPSDPDEER